MNRATQVVTCLSHDPQDTQSMGEIFATYLSAGSLVLLKGNLGAGKTELIKGIAAGLSIDDIPTSPTFTIVQTYGQGNRLIHHFDLYRLHTLSELEGIGIDDYLESNACCLIEWAEKFPGFFDPDFEVVIEKEGDTVRKITLTALKEKRFCQDEQGRLLPAFLSGEDKSDFLDQSYKKEKSLEGLPLGQEDINVGKMSKKGNFEERKKHHPPLVLAFDTANDVVSVGIGALDMHHKTVEIIATRERMAERASNTSLLPLIDALLLREGISKESLSCVVIGRGPGSFTGVRIALAAAKGIANALSLPLIGVMTLDAIAWRVHAQGIRGDLLVLGDAMRKEVFVAYYKLDDTGVESTQPLQVQPFTQFASTFNPPDTLHVCGDALKKYGTELDQPCTILPRHLWDCTGEGLLRAFQALWQRHGFDPLDPRAHVPAHVLPLYTRLSDAEEHERVRARVEPAPARPSGAASAPWQNRDATALPGSSDALQGSSQDDKQPLQEKSCSKDSPGAPSLKKEARTLQGNSCSDDATYEDDAKDEARTLQENLTSKNASCMAQAPQQEMPRRRSLHAQAHVRARENGEGVVYLPLSHAQVSGAARLEQRCMSTDAWSEAQMRVELQHENRIWWVAVAGEDVVGYAGGMVVDHALDILKIAVEPAWRRHALATDLMKRMCDDAYNLAATLTRLEVRISNISAQRFYEKLGFQNVGVRKKYYSDGEDALLYERSLPLFSRGVAGMEIQGTRSDECTSYENQTGRDEAPLILAIESSCDETAAAVVDGSSHLLSDVLASQIEFHSRFGGVVPEIASRKHIEAISTLCETALEQSHLQWRNLDAIASTYAPGLLGGLVIGVSYGKAAAWALDIPFIVVNHLEGHLYANKLADADFKPPAVVSLLSGGNTILVYMQDWQAYIILGETIDDAVGEAYDKVAKALGLGYPGGPAISAAAKKGDPHAIDFPRAMLHSKDYSFSLSGLKTAVMNYLNRETNAGRSINVADVAASFQQAIIDVQVAKAAHALKETQAPTFCLGGGVAANQELRQAYAAMCEKLQVKFIVPPQKSCGDNAGMIALVALDRYRKKKFAPLDIDAYARASLDVEY